MTFLDPCWAILPEAQQKLWAQLKPAAELGFVLYGGTAVALRLGHRTSVDFDFFTHRALDRQEICDNFAFIKRATVLQDQRNTFTVNVPCVDSKEKYVKVSFFGSIDFGRVGEPQITADGVLQVASLDDLMATKLKVILQRAEAKDYCDIAAMINAGASLSRGLAAALKLYGSNFQPSESLKALVYFDDGDIHTLLEQEKISLIQAVQNVSDLPAVAILSQQLTSSILPGSI